MRQQHFLHRQFVILSQFYYSLHFKVTKIPEDATRYMPLKVIIDYFKLHMEGRQIFITSLLIMATGFSYTTLLPVLTNKVFPGKSEIFGIAMTMCAIGGVCNASFT